MHPDAPPAIGLGHHLHSACFRIALPSVLAPPGSPAVSPAKDPGTAWAGRIRRTPKRKSGMGDDDECSTPEPDTPKRVKVGSPSAEAASSSLSSATAAAFLPRRPGRPPKDPEAAAAKRAPPSPIQCASPFARSRPRASGTPTGLQPSTPSTPATPARSGTPRCSVHPDAPTTPVSGRPLSAQVFFFRPPAPFSGFAVPCPRLSHFATDAWCRSAHSTSTTRSAR